MFYLLLVILTFLLVYFSVFGIRVSHTEFTEFPKANAKRKFAILIPARNEEFVIGNCIRSLQKQNYPKEKIEIYVVVNNCTDHTEEVAKSNGAEIIRCKIPVKTKGDVLSYAFKSLRFRNDIDAYVIFDADNVVATDFLDNMNDALDQGYKIIQGRRCGKNSKKNTITQIYELFYMMQNYYFNAFNNQRGLSASLNGTGWAITKQWIDTYGFNMKTMVEDLELTAQAALTDSIIGYTNFAVTYDEYPESIKTVLKQLPRWIYGQVECMRVYTFELMRRIQKKSCRILFLIFCGPLILLPIIVIFVYSFISVIVCMNVDAIIWFTILLVIAYLLCITLEMLELHMYDEPFKEYKKSVALFPMFLLLWVPYAIVSLFKRSCNWTYIKHDCVIEIEELL